ncbi:GNAT family N-acetyltransferase [Flavobacteriales bacterium]|nr:GNAT family N-acetyltransferase [Flavobacteriales bacterium]
MESNRLKFKLVNGGDIDFFHQLLSLPESNRYNTLGAPKNREESKEKLSDFVLKNEQKEIVSYTFVITTKQDNKPIGLFGLNLKPKRYKGGEVWYTIHTKDWNKGFATESLKRIIEFCFNELKLHRIQAGCAVDNISSIKVLEKSGMTKEGRGRQILPLSNGWSDNYEYSILETDLKKK